MDGPVPRRGDCEPRRRRQSRRRRIAAGGRPMTEAVLSAGPRIAAHALELEDLDVVYRVRGRDCQCLRGVPLAVRRGEAYGLVGESGCGKSTAALAIVQYLPRNGRVRSGGIRIDGRDVLSLSSGDLRRLRSESVSMVYQNPGSALNPSIRVGKQLAEVFTARGTGKAEATERSLAMLRQGPTRDP